MSDVNNQSDLVQFNVYPPHYLLSPRESEVEWLRIEVAQKE